MTSNSSPPTLVADFINHPLSIWIEATFGLATEGDKLVRAVPLAVDGPDGGAAALAAATGVDQNRCSDAIRAQLMAGYEVLNPDTGFTSSSAEATPCTRR